MSKRKPAPRNAWGAYLDARLRLIGEWTNEGKTPHEILRILAMDLNQVVLLQMTATARIRPGEV